MADPYDILGVGRSASEQQIKTAYRTLAKELHPDRNKDKPDAAERFSDITKAYDLLSDKKQRARYDRGEIDLIFPTRRNLERLAQFDDFDQARAHAEATPMPTIVPWVEERPEGRSLCIPADCGYPVTSVLLGDAKRG